MDKFKLHAGDFPSYSVNKDIFDRQTQCKPPYYQKGADGKMRHYAVCPACDNPTQIVGLIRTHHYQKKPYAKHYHEPIIDRGKALGRFSKARYEWCPYSKHSKKTLSQSDKVPMSDYARDILNHITTYYDRIVYFIGKTLGVVIPDDQAEKMLEEYLAAEGYLYAGATLMNIPWMVAYMAAAKSLLDVRLYDADSKLAHMLTDHVNEIFLNEKRYVKRRPGTDYILLTHTLLEHKRSCPDHTLTESLTWMVTLEKHFKESTVYETHIEFDYDGYQRLLNFKQWNEKKRLLEKARQLVRQ